MYVSINGPEPTWLLIEHHTETTDPGHALTSVLARTYQSRWKRKSTYKRLVVFLGLFLFIYSPFLKMGNVVVKLPFILLGAYGSFGAPQLVRQFITNRMFRNSVSVKIAGLLVISYLYLLHGRKDSTIFTLILPGFAAIAGALLFVRTYYALYKSRYLSTLLIHMFYVGVLHGLIIIAILVSANARAIAESLFFYSDKAVVSLLTLSSSSGILFEGYGILSITQAMTFVCGLVVMSVDYQLRGAVGTMKFVIGATVIFVSIVLSGRTGLLVFLVGLAVFGAVSMVARSSGESGRSRKFPMLVLVAVLSALTVYSVSFVEELTGISNALRHGFELYFVYADEGRIGTASTDVLFGRMFHGVTDLVGLLFGTGNYLSDGSLESDVGYVKLLFGSGIVGIVAALGYYVHVGFVAYHERTSNRSIAFILTYLCCTMLVVNLKDFYIDNMQGQTQIFSLCFALLVTSQIYRKANTPNDLPGSERRPH